MREELDEKLCKKFPEIFRDRRSTMDKTAMCWGFQHDDGWYDIVEELCEQLMFIKKLTGVGVVANTVKEKFGALRFYTWGDEDSKPTISEEDGKLVNDLIDNAISVASMRSSNTCEVCGNHGESREWARWIYTRCYKHWKELMKEQYGWDIPENERDYEEWHEKTMKEIETKQKANEKIEEKQ